MNDTNSSPARHPRWRDPLSIGWQAHRGLLLLRLRWHASPRHTASSRRDGR